MVDIPAPVEGHTPGPWNIVEYGDGDSLVICQGDGPDWRICFMATPGSSPRAMERIEADAALIARSPAMASEIATLKARVAELEADADDAYSDAYADGQGDANGAAGDLWHGVIAFLTARKVTIHSDEGDWSYTAQEVADALGEEVGDLDRTITRLKAEKAELVAGLVSIRDMEDRPYEGPHFDRAAVDACPECQRYAGHPIQNGICDEHRHPLYAREKHDAFENEARGYRASSIARSLLSKLEGGE